MPDSDSSLQLGSLVPASQISRAVWIPDLLRTLAFPSVLWAAELLMPELLSVACTQTLTAAGSRK